MRLDSDSSFQCELNQDPFLKLQKVHYSFLLSYHEGGFTIPTLWHTVRSWTNKSNVKMNNEHNKKGLSFISDNGGLTLSGHNCMFYNNFEMARFSVFRNKSYIDYFNFLDKSGGFFYERWVSDLF